MKSILNYPRELNIILGMKPIDAINLLLKKYKIPSTYIKNKKKLQSCLLTLNIKSKSDIRQLLDGINTRELITLVPNKHIQFDKHNNANCKCKMCTPILKSQLTKFIKIAQPIMINNVKYYENATKIYKKLINELCHYK